MSYSLLRDNVVAIFIVILRTIDRVKRTRPHAAVVATSAAIVISFASLHCPTAEAQELNVQEVRKIDAPRVFHPPTEDTPGYWQDFGITTAFDFSKSSHLLVAVIKDSAGPTRLFTFDLEQATIKSQPTVSTNPHAEID